MRRILPLVFLALIGAAAVARAASEPIRLDIRAGDRLVRRIPETMTSASASLPAAPQNVEQGGWQLQATVSNVLHGVSFADPLNGFAAAELGAVYRTTNGGKTWTTVMNVGFPYYWYGVQAFSANTAMVVGFQDQSGAGIARWTDNGGATWTSDVVIDSANWLLAVKYLDANHGLAYGNSGYVYVTSNGGRNAGDWTKVTTDPQHGWLAGNFTILPDMNVFITGINFSHSTDGGLTWTIAHSADSVFDGGCSFVDDLHGWTGGGQISAPVSGWVHRTTNGGATWSARLMQPSYPIRIAQFYSQSFGFVAGGNIYGAVGGIWATTDTGNTWSLDADTGAEMSWIDQQAVSADSTDVWCVGSKSNFTGVIYKKRISLGNPAAVDNPVRPAPTVAWAAPNPFLTRTRITLAAPAAAVFDYSGRKVRALDLVLPGVFAWDGRDETGRVVPAGIYLVRRDDGTGPGVKVLRLR